MELIGRAKKEESPFFSKSQCVAPLPIQYVMSRIYIRDICLTLWYVVKSGVQLRDCAFGTVYMRIRMSRLSRLRVSVLFELRVSVPLEFEFHSRSMYE